MNIRNGNFAETFKLNLDNQELTMLKGLAKNCISGERIFLHLPGSEDGFKYYLKIFYLLENGYSIEIPEARISDVLKCGPDFQWGTFTEGLASGDCHKFEESNASISACVLTQNSERTIDKCLRSLTGWTNEIIVFDSESSDRTIEIVSQYTDKVFICRWPGDFSIQRNRLIEKVTSDWMLMIDSDEFVGKDFGREIRRTISYALDRGFDLIWLPRYWLTCNKENSSSFNSAIKGHWLFWPDPQGRLANMRTEPYYEGEIHETLKLREDSKSLLLCYPKIAIRHLRLIDFDYSKRRESLINMNKIDCSGPHNIQLLPENFLESLNLEEIEE